MRRAAAAGAMLTACWIASPQRAAAQTYTLSATADTYIQQANPTTATGTANVLHVDPTAGSQRRALVLFDVSTTTIPAGQLVISATLRMFVTQTAASSTVRAHRATAAWTEAAATWNSMNANFDATVLGSVTPSASQFYTFDVTSAVQAWRAGAQTNNGFMLTATGTGQSRWASRTNNTTANRPQLVVVTTVQPSYSVLKVSQLVSDPVNGTTQPKRMPGAVIDYSVTVSNTSAGLADSNSLGIVEAVPSQTTLYVGDLGAAGSGPVSFSNGTPSSTLTYTYSSLSSGADDLAFSSDGGASYTYTPVPDGSGYDTLVTHVRVSPKGVFAASTGAGDPKFTYQFRVKSK